MLCRMLAAKARSFRVGYPGKASYSFTKGTLRCDLPSLTTR